MSAAQGLDKEELTSLLNWTATQGQILTGDGILQAATQEGVDFKESDLPHYLLRNRISRSTFKEWLAANKRSFAITGCWSRPIFSGGWKESGDADTEAFNLQTPSLFIDMRYPRKCPRDVISRRRQSLTECSDVELRMLARQHCFSGYSYLEPTPDKHNADKNSNYNNKEDSDNNNHKHNDSNTAKQKQFPPMFTRHHIIDWNYHPRFPRNRPNRWWVELSPDSDSFKEYSFARDANNVPVYFERWARYADDTKGRKYLAIRKVTDCPAKAIAEGRVPVRDAVIIVVGNHFAMAHDRSTHTVPQFPYYSSAAANPGSLVDSALTNGQREDAEKLLDFVGCYGIIRRKDGDRFSDKATWEIKRCTHPWLEGKPLFEFGSAQLFWTTASPTPTPMSVGGTSSSSISSSSNSSISSDISGGGGVGGKVISIKGEQALEKILFNGFEWAVVECSFDNAEIRALFPQVANSRL